MVRCLIVFIVLTTITVLLRPRSRFNVDKARGITGMQPDAWLIKHEDAAQAEPICVASRICCASRLTGWLRFFQA
jgi:hypothetical protein